MGPGERKLVRSDICTKDGNGDKPTRRQGDNYSGGETGSHVNAGWRSRTEQKLNKNQDCDRSYSMQDLYRYRSVEGSLQNTPDHKWGFLYIHRSV